MFPMLTIMFAFGPGEKKIVFGKVSSGCNLYAPKKFVFTAPEVFRRLYKVDGELSQSPTACPEKRTKQAPIRLLSWTQMCIFACF